MAVSAIGGGGSLLMQKAQSTQNKANQLATKAEPLEDAATKNLGAKEMASAAKPIMAQAATVAKAVSETTQPMLQGKLSVKA